MGSDGKVWPCVGGREKRRRSRDITPRLGSELPRSDGIRIPRVESADKVRGVRDVLPADPRPLQRRVTDPVDEVLERVAEFTARQDLVDLVLLVAVISDNGSWGRDGASRDGVGADTLE